MLGARVLRTVTLSVVGLWLAVLPAGCKRGGEDEGGGHPFLYVAGEQNITWYSFNADDGSLEKKDSIKLDLTAAYLAKSPDAQHLHVLIRTNPADETAI